MIDLIKSPVLTEKAFGLMNKNQFTLNVDGRLTKPQIKKLCNQVFNVNVISVNTYRLPLNKRAKGSTQQLKRAIITLPKGQTIDCLQL